MLAKRRVITPNEWLKQGWRLLVISAGVSIRGVISAINDIKNDAGRNLGGFKECEKLARAIGPK